MSSQRQNIYHGSPSWETSIANKDLITSFVNPNDSSNSTASTIAWKFEFYTKSDIHISINNSQSIFLETSDTLTLNDVWSFKILDNDATYRYVAYL